MEFGGKRLTVRLEHWGPSVKLVVIDTPCQLLPSEMLFEITSLLKLVKLVGNTIMCDVLVNYFNCKSHVTELILVSIGTIIREGLSNIRFWELHIHEYLLNAESCHGSLPVWKAT